MRWILNPARLCPATTVPTTHIWSHEDSADLRGYGDPNYGMTLFLGRCTRCNTALFDLYPEIAEREHGTPRYELTGVEVEWPD